MIQAINDIAPHSQYVEFLRHKRLGFIEDVESVVRALLNDLLNEHFTGNIFELAHGEIFSDLLDMAQHLVDNGYFLAATVVAGTAQESHLRQLAIKKGLAIVDNKGKPLTGDPLNVELSKAKVYDLNMQKLVTAWQGLRNDAAHGRGANFDKSQIQVMIDGIRMLIARNPA